MKYNTTIKYLLLFVVFFFTACRINAQKTGDNSTNDTSYFTILPDSSIINLDKRIKDQELWLNILKNDSSFINFFKLTGGTKAYYIHIATIKYIPGDGYEFLIYSRPLNVTPVELPGFGYADYLIILKPQIKGPPRISEIKRIGIVM